MQTSNEPSTTKRRRTFDAGFKARAVLELVNGRRSLDELAQRYGVHPNQIKNWRTQMNKRLSDIFVDRRTQHARRAARRRTPAPVTPPCAHIARSDAASDAVAPGNDTTPPPDAARKTVVWMEYSSPPP